jgi:putative flippase GtrA
MYAIVAASALVTSYAVFTILVLTLLSFLPQAAVIIGSAVGAVVSYQGHLIYSFRPISPTSTRKAESSAYDRLL